ncbi:MAG: HNH endonuclease [Actinomycetales bacterium]
MREPPFLIAVPSDRHFEDDHCANCLEPIPDDVDALFCSAWCSEIAEAVRYQRRVFRDGRIERPDVREAVGVRNAFILAGGYRSLARTLTTTTRAEVKTRDGGRCQSCGKTGTEIDHIDGSSADLSNLQLLCSDCHHAKTAENLVPASPEQSDLLKGLFLSRVAPDKPKLLVDDEVEWAKLWRSLKSARKKRFVDRLVDLGVDIGGVKTRAEMVLVLEDFMSDMADDSGVPDDYDGGYGPDSYFARAMQKND